MGHEERSRQGDINQIPSTDEIMQESPTSSEPLILFAPGLTTSIVFRTRAIVSVVYSIVFSANPVKPYYM